MTQNSFTFTDIKSLRKKKLLLKLSSVSVTFFAAVSGFSIHLLRAHETVELSYSTVLYGLQSLVQILI